MVESQHRHLTTHHPTLFKFLLLTKQNETVRSQDIQESILHDVDHFQQKTSPRGNRICTIVLDRMEDEILFKKHFLLDKINR